VILPKNQPKKPAKIAAAKKANKVVICFSSEVNTVIISNANIANKTPMGSTIMPSHFKIFAGRGFSFDWRNNGRITVGPITINKPPITKATNQDKPAIECAVSDPKIHAKKAPIVDILKTGLPNPLNSLKFKFKLPSNKIIATATDITGL